MTNPRPGGSSPKFTAGGILREGVIVAISGLLVALAANALSPRGLVLNRNYFPGDVRGAPVKSSPSVVASNAAPGVMPHPSPETLTARLQAKGLQLADSNQVAQLFHDPRYEQELVVFIDARDDQHYQEGHIPGAYQFDHYHAENYIATVLPVCQTAQQVVIYCTGGDCEDSEFAATTLASAGISHEKLLIYGGGITEWTANGLPVEMGERKSGQLKKPTP